MTDLSPYELRVLRQMATGEDEGIVAGAALNFAKEALGKRGLITCYKVYVCGLADLPLSALRITEAGRALVRERALDELMASDAELTETKNG